MGPPSLGSEHRDACASWTPPRIAALVSPLPPRKAAARDDVTESHAHPLAANWRSWEQHASEGSGMAPESAALRMVAQSADAYFAAYDLKDPDREPQGPDCRPDPSRVQVMESAGGRGGGGRGRGRERVG
jgi:hypothetical protein